ncbi:MAG: hypothetical protein LQ343_001942 [Gyalolechia ehrenbergii]|nr:MAG: hypothetical protein LQ343_001942 [Gyalolechia ehrenbergii]
MANTTLFDPFTQSFTLLMRDGTPFNVTIPELDDFILYSVQISITYAAQLGASLIFLIVLLLLTKPDKRKSPIFILNSVALILNFLRTLLHCLYFTGPFSETYAYFSVDYSRVSGSDYASQVAITVLTWLLLVCVEVSLLLQVQVVCVTLREGLKRLIFAFSAMIAGLALAFRLALCVENSKYILSLEPEVSLQWLASASNITTSISICWFCAVFVIKLGFALDQRRKLKVGTFRPMQIIFIMGCQTLVIPAIFSIIEYWVPLPSIDSHVLTLVTIFLPLSSLWASASVDNRKRSLEQPMVHGKLLSSKSTATTGPLVGEKFLDGPLSPSATATTKTSNSSLPSPAKTHDQHINVDLEAQENE